MFTTALLVGVRCILKHRMSIVIHFHLDSCRTIAVAHPTAICPFPANGVIHTQKQVKSFRHKRTWIQMQTQHCVMNKQNGKGGFISSVRDPFILFSVILQLARGKVGLQENICLACGGGGERGRGTKIGFWKQLVTKEESKIDIAKDLNVIHVFLNLLH